MRRFTTVLLFLCLVMCGHTGYMTTTTTDLPIHQCFFPIPVGISNNVSIEDQAIILDGLKYWNSIRPSLFFFMGVVPWASDNPMGNGIITIGQPDNYALAQMPGERKAATTSYEAEESDGCLRKAHINLLYPLSKDTEVGKVIIRHELGHVLGLAHTNEVGALMNAKQRVKNVPCCLSPTELDTLEEMYP